MNNKPNQKAILVFAVVIFVFIMIMIAPVVEMTAYKNGKVIMQSTKRMILPGSQSLLTLPTGEVPDKVDIKIVQNKETDYYLCEGEPPKTLSEVKKTCDYLGNDGG